MDGLLSFEIEETEEFYNENEENIFWQVIDLLHKNGMGFLTENPWEFPEIDTNLVDSPEIINNAIIEIDGINPTIHRKLFDELDDMMCRYAEVWFFSSCSYEDIARIVTAWDGGFLRGVRIIIDMARKDGEDVAKYSNLISASNKIDEIVFFNCNELPASNSPKVTYLQKDISDLNYKTNEYNRIVMEMSFYLQAKNRNPFYYKKVCIDKQGNIKNFLANKKTFGNIKINSLVDVCKSDDFQKLWNVTNDQIIDIKDSPMRYCYSITDDLIPLDNGYYKMKTNLKVFPWDNVQ